MITLDNCSLNGWFFKSMVDGVGVGKCEKCGFEREFKNELNPEEHKCDDEGK